jgi:hypothetical protein
MPVALLPPITQSLHTPTTDPITEGPRYLRSPGMSRWHRPRSAYQPHPAGATAASGRRMDHVAWLLWCGQTAYDGATPVLRAEQVPDGEPVCGTCEGRALGAGQDNLPVGLPRLRFDPRWITPPTLCPGSGRADIAEQVPSARGSIARCLACGQLEAMRGRGSAYYPSYGLTRHPPGDGLLPPCWWHAWHHITLVAPGRAGCACGWHQRTEVA